MIKKQKRAPRKTGLVHDLADRGIAAAKAGRWAECVGDLEACARLGPADLLVQLNLARAYLHLGQLDLALRIATDVRQAHHHLEVAAMIQAEAHNRLQRFAEAEACLLSLPEASRTSKAYWYSLGYAQQIQGRHTQAINSFMNALSIKMDDALTHHCMGLSFFEMNLKDEACECFRTALLLGVEAQTIRALGTLAFAERETCQWGESEPHLQRLRELVDALEPGSAVDATLFAHATMVGDPYHQLKIARAMTRRWQHFLPVAHKNRPYDTGRRLRLGYVSGDFHAHATCVLMAELFEHHDKSRFEIFAYSHGPDERSVMRTRVEAAIEHFVDVRLMSNFEVAQRIAEDQIDVLIDLKGHTAANRLEIFAYRPAPVQVTFLGFPGTTGGDFMDYVVGDPIVTPMEHAEHFSEKIAQMPVCYQPNDRKRPLPQSMTRAEAGLP